MKHLQQPEEQSLREKMRRLYPHLSEEELEEAELHLRAYADLVVSIYQRLEADPEAMARLRRILVETEQDREFESSEG